MKYLPWCLVALATSASVYFWYEMSTKVNESQQFEAKMLAAQGLNVEKDATIKQLQAETKELVNKSAALTAELDKAKKALPKIKIVEVREAHTEPVQVKEEIKPEDKLQLKISELTLKTEAGNHILVGSIQLWRLEPPPEKLLIDKPLRYTIGDRMAKEEDRKGWPTWTLFAAAGLGSVAAVALRLVLHH